MKESQKERILQMLMSAGEEGVRSDEFYKAYMPRAGARIHELRKQGYAISSRAEGKFVRYVLTGMPERRSFAAMKKRIEARNRARA